MLEHKMVTIIGHIPGNYCLSIFFHLLLFGVLSAETQAQNDKFIPVLIVDGFSNHDWKQTTAVTKWILEESYPKGKNIGIALARFVPTDLIGVDTCQALVLVCEIDVVVQGNRIYPGEIGDAIPSD